MDIKLTAKNKQGKETLERMIKDNSKIMAHITIIKEEPKTILLKIKALRMIPAKLKEQPAVKNVIITAINDIVEGYQGRIQDLEID